MRPEVEDYIARYNNWKAQKIAQIEEEKRTKVLLDAGLYEEVPVEITRDEYLARKKFRDVYETKEDGKKRYYLTSDRKVPLSVTNEEYEAVLAIQEEGKRIQETIREKSAEGSFGDATGAPYIKSRVSAGAVSAFAGLLLIAGIILLISGIATNKSDSGLTIGFGAGCLLSSAFLFIISNIANDIHEIAVKMEHYHMMNMKNARQGLASLDELRKNQKNA